jgi:N-acetylglucosaminyldiphosphoundecaprenol N-acetyl-beta-D-mannosaminyltransferase
MMAVRDDEFRQLLDESDITAPDGRPVAWALRSLGIKSQPQVRGTDLMTAISAQSAVFGHRIFLYGSTADTLARLRSRFERNIPGLQIVGAYAPPFRPLRAAEDEECVRQILDSGADIVFVGLGAPKQERWMAGHRSTLAGIVMVGVGAAFDFYSGKVTQAPRWVQRTGLEWLFRLVVEPRRLWKRYVLFNPLFLAMWSMQMAGFLKFNQNGAEPRRRTATTTTGGI